MLFIDSSAGTSQEQCYFDQSRWRCAFFLSAFWCILYSHHISFGAVHYACNAYANDSLGHVLSMPDGVLGRRFRRR